MLKNFTIGCLVAMTLLFTVGCQKQEIKAPEIKTEPKLDERIIKLSSDQQVQKELLFMKEKMGIDLSNVSIGKGQASGDYGIFNGWDGYGISRDFVQQQIKKAD